MSKLLLVICSSLPCREVRIVSFCLLILILTSSEIKAITSFLSFLKRHQSDKKNPNLSNKTSPNKLKQPYLMWQKPLCLLCQVWVKAPFNQRLLYYPLSTIPQIIPFSRWCVSRKWDRCLEPFLPRNISILLSAHISPCNQQDDLNVGSKKQKAG